MRLQSTLDNEDQALIFAENVMSLFVKVAAAWSLLRRPLLFNSFRFDKSFSSHSKHRSVTILAGYIVFAF